MTRKENNNQTKNTDQITAYILIVPKFTKAQNTAILQEASN